MKEIILLIITLAIASASFAQNNGDDATIEKNAKNDYFILDGDYIIHYFLDIQTDTIFNDVSLRNGNTLTSKGELVEKKRKMIFLKGGQCVDAKGNIADCDKLKARLENQKNN